MAVQKISGKHIIKRNENFKPVVNTNSYGIEPDYSVSSNHKFCIFVIMPLSPSSLEFDCHLFFAI